MKRSLLVVVLSFAGSSAWATQPAQTAVESPTPELPTGNTARPADPGDIGASIDISFMYDNPPIYPADAQKARVTGTVVLQVRVAADGSVTEIKVEKSSHSKELDAAALAAAKKWRFKPAYDHGKPAEGLVRVPVTFRP